MRIPYAYLENGLELRKHTSQPHSLLVTRLIAPLGGGGLFTFVRACNNIYKTRAASPTIPMARGGDPHIVLDDPALKLDGHLSVLATRAAAEHPTASTGHACEAYVSVQDRLSKARTAFPVGPLARVEVVYAWNMMA